MNKHLVLLFKVFLFANLSGALAQADEASAVPKLLTADEAIESALAEPLTYVGSFISSSSISRIPSCVFRNSKVTLMYTYCRQKEAPALGIKIYSRNAKRGHVTFYAEGDGRAVSQLNRREYINTHFRVLSRENLAGYKTNFTAKKFAAYHEKEITYYQLGCQIWLPSGHSLRADCLEAYKAQEKAWLDSSLNFWIEPKANWYELQNLLRSEVVKTKLP